ncbi:E3 ubiquitin-protein ligase RSL1-like [Gastrolobium bilobum]|uniref:E3 ubiquitin-protein ligase RSL1-like n=1 Tax=Gastrolobium bilobum TaxID=150636 RepID=UPI002AAF0D8B|nr:E3 ubiquitin-protein ligase RSL1-like [Gastrolobium bilobum]
MAGQSSKLFCGICFDFKPESDMFIRSKCNHPFCTDCISNYVATQIQKNVVNVNCPNPKCSVELKPKHLQPIMPKQVIDRWESARYESSIVGLQKAYCPFKDCSVLLVNDGNVVTNSECTSCHRLFCAQCKVPWHAGTDCKEFQKLKRSEREKELDLMFCELAKLKMWQKCPTCSIYVESCGGCEHITCRCGRHFCYICGENWEFGHLCCILGPHEISQVALELLAYSI